MSNNTGSRNYDVIVVGGGVAGTMTAYKLADDYSVLVIDKGLIGGGTSSRASGAIATHSSYVDLPAWGKQSMSFFHEFDNTGIFEFTQRPKIQPIKPENEDKALREEEKENVNIYDIDEVKNVYPNIFNDLSSYSYLLEYQDCGLIDIQELIYTLKHEAKTKGVDFYPDTNASKILIEDGSVTGVKTEYEEIHAPTVVCSCGSSTKQLLKKLVQLPMRQFVWNAIIVDLDIEIQDNYPIGSETSEKVYWRPTSDGSLLIGGEHFAEIPNDGPKISDRLLEVVNQNIPNLLNGFEGANIIRTEYCHMPDSTTPDARPIIDAPPTAPDGLIIAAGFHGTGVMSSPSIASAVYSLISGEKTSFDLSQFKLDRFEQLTDDFEPKSLYDIQV